MKLIKRVAPSILAVCLLYYALKDIRYKDLAGEFYKANYYYITAIIFVVACLDYLRGLRWMQPLAVLGHHTTAFRAMIALQSGMIASMVIPGSGEFTRGVSLQRIDNVPLAHSLGSIVAERVLDLLILLILLFVTTIIEFGRIYEYAKMFKAMDLFKFLLLVCSLSPVLFLLLKKIFQSPGLKSNLYFKKITLFIREIWNGFVALKELPNPILFVSLTFLIQGLFCLIVYLFLQSQTVTSHLPPVAALTILVVASIGGLAVPTQGGLGTYHFLVSRALVLYGLSTAEGAVVATFMHAVGFAINLVLSSISFLIIPVLIQRRNKEVALEAENE